MSGRGEISPSTVRAVARKATCLAAVALVGLGVFASTAGAVGPNPEAENFIPRVGEPGAGAGQMLALRSLAVNSTNGDVYVSDESRIDEFTPWGQFIMAFGWGVADGISEELQQCTTTCFKALSGSGAGEFSDVDGIAIDASGDVYVREAPFSSSHFRVQKFTPSGQLLLSFGGRVDLTKVHKREEQEAHSEPVTVTEAQEDVCTVASGDQCGPGLEGTSPGWFSGGSAIRVTPTGEILVADTNRIEEFEADGTYKSELSFGGKGISNIAVDPRNSDIYAEIEGIPGISRFGPNGEPMGSVTVREPAYMGVDQDGNLYVYQGAVIEGAFTSGDEITEFDSSGKKLAEFDAVANRPDRATIGDFAVSAIGDVYVVNRAESGSYISAYGPGPVVYESPPVVAPTIESEYAVSSDIDSAAVQAQINPHFWSDTKYYVEYGLSDCAISACASQPAAPGIALTSKAVAAAIKTEDVALSGLEPNTTYHYRFVAQGSGGGPVYGPDSTFTTYPELTAELGCPNQAFRVGPSALLPDCRAYEMVSPIEKNNGDAISLPDSESVSSALDQSALSGDTFTYSSYRAFGESRAAPAVNQYLATRDSGSGWRSVALSPFQHPDKEATNNLNNEFRVFSPDLSMAWLSTPGEPVLAPGGTEDFRSLYRQDTGSDEMQALTPVSPPGVSSVTYEPEVQGVSADGARTVFRADGRLTDDASAAPGERLTDGVYQLYEHDADGSLRLVSVLPDGTASNQASSVGSLTGAFNEFGDLSNVRHAVSNDGLRVYWSQTNMYADFGPLYVRENSDMPQSAISSGKCTEPEAACTLTVSSKPSRFLVASADGAYAVYSLTEGTHAGELYEFELEEGESTRIARQVDGVLGASEDLSYLYFISKEALAPGAQAGQLNLYVRHEEVISYIATLSNSETQVTLVDERYPVFRTSRVTPDGRHVVFVSTLSLTGYDNTDAITGKRDAEVYMYDAESKVLNCLSCNRGGARPSGGVPNEYSSVPFQIAATIPGWENEYYPSRVVSDNGDRVFFDSYVALVPRDTNGVEDVYEWEAPGAGSCTVESLAYSSTNGGCVSLISSGESPEASQFADASPSGSDVFFTTGASLLPEDSGLIDIYDARTEGGFPPVTAAAASCEGEACQGIAVGPVDSTPASVSFSGPGNVTTEPAVVEPKKLVKKQASRPSGLSRALRTCHAKAGAKRRRCEAAARKRYARNAQRGRNAQRRTDRGRKSGTVGLSIKGGK